MLDPSLCNRPDSYWLVFKSMLADWLMTPALVLLAARSDFNALDIAKAALSAAISSFGKRSMPDLLDCNFSAHNHVSK